MSATDDVQGVSGQTMSSQIVSAQTGESPADDTAGAWHQTACILCECNCGVEVRLGGENGRQFVRIRGDKAHPASAGYTCEKALRLDHYQNGTKRITSPLRRRADGTFEEIDWDTAIREVAAGFAKVRDTHGGESILYYGGGGQGNHLGGAYSGATLRAMGNRFKSNALAQEKTGEFWVNGKMFGSLIRGDFEHCEVALFIGKNPWQSHSIPRARTTLKEIAKDPTRSMIVIDPRRTETAELADFHLQVKPGTDAWCLSALAAVIVQEQLVATDWVRDHVTDVEPVVDALRAIPVTEFAAMCGVDEDLLRRTARRIAAADSVAVAEDLGIQMGLHSTLNSWLEKLVWVLTGNFGRLGTQYNPTSLVPIARGSGAKKGSGDGPRSPVAGARIITGLIPCNVIPEEILTDHPKRYRALLVESGNPAHSLADSQRMREAISTLEHVVVIDVTMTETARLAHYVLPAQSQFEKWESTFFNFEWPKNVFHLRRPVLDPTPGTLPEPEIHARLVEALGELTEADYTPLREALASGGREAFAGALFAAAADPRLGPLVPLLLYRTLGPTLPHGAASAAVLWGAAHRCAIGFEASVRRAGFDGEGLQLGENLFDAIVNSPSGLTFAVDEPDDPWQRIATDDGRIHLDIPELREMLTSLITSGGPVRDDEFPFVLSAGERRSFSANTIIRDPSWRKKDSQGALRIGPTDAERLGLITGSRARLTTSRGSTEVVVEVSEMMQPGHVSLPNGMGLDEPDETGVVVRTGTAPNELTDASHRDPIAGTPYHKHVPARLEAVP
jgi:anaerobic selenocysteine-containing dehydrogenase